MSSEPAENSAEHGFPGIQGARVAGLAQLVEHLICNQGVGGSSPLAGTKNINKTKTL